MWLRKSLPDRDRPRTFGAGRPDGKPHEPCGSVRFVKIRGTIPEDVAVGFIVHHLSNQSLAAFLGDERMRAFRDLVADGKTIAAAAEYQSVTGAGLPECHLAVELAVAIKRESTAE